MTNKTKFLVSEVARLRGVAPKTIYGHIKKKPISTELNDDGQTVIDLSELVRVYGNNLDLAKLDENYEPPRPSSSESSAEDAAQLSILEERLKSKEDLIRMQEERIQGLEGDLEEEKRERKRTTLLLEDHTKNKDEESKKWQDVFEHIKEQSSNSEKALREELARTKRLASNYRSQLQEEKNKGFFQKLFG